MSERKDLTSSAVGGVPMISRLARRINDASSQRPDGTSPKDFHFLATSSSTKVPEGTGGYFAIWKNGTVILAIVACPPKRTIMLVSPLPTAFAVPSGETATIESLRDCRRAHRVTSRFTPSE